MSFQTNFRELSQGAKRALSKTQIKKQIRSYLDCIVDCPDVLATDLQLSVTQFRDTYLYQTMFDKYCELDLESADLRREACIEKYLACEDACRETNNRFRGSEFQNTKFHHLLMLTRQKISDILGPWDEEYLYSDCGFGPGATLSKKSPYLDTAFKFEGTPTTTVRLLRRVQDWVKPIWDKFQLVDTAKFTTVPKNAKIDRPIEIQADLCIFFQKSLGKIIRRKMKGLPVGRAYTLDLNNQDINRQLAYLASIDGTLATLDLSSASDLIAFELVSYLIEDAGWFDALLTTRMDYVSICDKPLEKFSAMGNGYTWELQSLIFYSMIWAVTQVNGGHGEVTATFGDDIICRSSDVDLLIEFLTFCGFKVNTRKSHWTGFFRESCGKHYYHGVDVSPFYIRSPLIYENDVFKCHNRIFEWATALGFKDQRLKPLLAWLKGHSSLSDLRIPHGVGDVGFATCADDFSERTPFYKGWRHDGFIFRVLQPERSLLTWYGIGTLHKALSVGSTEISNSDIPFGAIREKLRWQRSHAWPSFGAWV